MGYHLFLKGLNEFVSYAFICSSIVPFSAIGTAKKYFTIFKVLLLSVFKGFG